MNTADMIRVFGRIGLLSFGGPAAQIALMQKELVEDRPLLTQSDFLKALSFCMMLPGPEAMQLATYAGWKLSGVRGGLIAGTLFVLPGAMVIAALAFAYSAFGTMDGVQAAFLGIKAAVIIIVVQAVLRLLSKVMQRRDHRILAALAFIALFVFNLPFPAVIGLAALWGAVACTDTHKETSAPPWRKSVGPLLIGGVLWSLPLVAAWAAGAGFLLAIGVFFSKLAVVTFGGAYAVLAYMTQAVVVENNWITTAQMIDALGLAETTPGPLILVTEFTAILAGIAQGGWGIGALAGLMALWVTFVPCFVWIFAGAPLIDWLDGYPRVRAALGAITAAVVGMIANLSLWFGVHVMFDDVGKFDGPLPILRPVWSSFDINAAVLTALAAALLMGLKMGLGRALGVMALAGIVISALN